MPKVIEIFACDICHSRYNTHSDAQICESIPTKIPKDDKEVGELIEFELERQISDSRYMTEFTGGLVLNKALTLDKNNNEHIRIYLVVRTVHLSYEICDVVYFDDKLYSPAESVIKTLTKLELETMIIDSKDMDASKINLTVLDKKANAE